MKAKKYSVVLNILPDSPYSKLLGQFCHKIISEDDSYLLHLWCSEVDISHPVYVNVVAHKKISSEDSKTSQESYKLQIPHGLVLMISDPWLEETKLPGFVSK